MSLTVDLSNTPELAQLMDKVTEAVGRRVQREVARTVIDIHREAVIKAPKDQGRLHSGLEWIVPTGKEIHEGRVFTRVKYAPFVEFGTGPLGSTSNLTTLAKQEMKSIGYTYGTHGGFPDLDDLTEWARRHSIPEEAVYPIAMSIWYEGTEAQPFLFPAVERYRPEFFKRLEIALAAGAEEAW